MLLSQRPPLPQSPGETTPLASYTRTLNAWSRLSSLSLESWLLGKVGFLIWFHVYTPSVDKPNNNWIQGQAQIVHAVVCNSTAQNNNVKHVTAPTVQFALDYKEKALSVTVAKSWLKRKGFTFGGSETKAAVQKAAVQKTPPVRLFAPGITDLDTTDIPVSMTAPLFANAFLAALQGSTRALHGPLYLSEMPALHADDLESRETKMQALGRWIILKSKSQTPEEWPRNSHGALVWFDIFKHPENNSSKGWTKHNQEIRLAVTCKQYASKSGEHVQSKQVLAPSVSISLDVPPFSETTHSDSLKAAKRWLQDNGFTVHEEQL
jgi:hypothetical protein